MAGEAVFSAVTRGGGFLWSAAAGTVAGVIKRSLFFPSRLLTRGAIAAGFSTRAGGDDAEALARAADFSLDRLFMVTQVHGARVLEIDGAASVEAVRSERCDALVTATAGVALAVRTADCVPVLLEGGGAVAAAHAGWRGLEAGVIEAAIEALSSRWAAAPSTLRAAVGPAIGPCCFEVGPDVAQRLSAAVDEPEVVRPGARGRPHVDLRRATALKLRAAGVPAKQIELVGPCTRCSADLLHSYRRHGPGGGRQISFVTINHSAERSGFIPAV